MNLPLLQTFNFQPSLLLNFLASISTIFGNWICVASILQTYLLSHLSLSTAQPLTLPLTNLSQPADDDDLTPLS